MCMDGRGDLVKPRLVMAEQRSDTFGETAEPVLMRRQRLEIADALGVRQ